MNATLNELGQILLAFYFDETEKFFSYDYFEAYSLIDYSYFQISTASPKIQSVIIKYAYEVLSSKVFNLNSTKAPEGYGNATIAKLLKDANYGDVTSFNPDLVNMLLVDLLTCFTSDIQFVWPGSNLTVNTTNVIDCQPVLSLTVQEYMDISSLILNSKYLTGTRYTGNRYKYFRDSIAEISSWSGVTNSTQIATINNTTKKLASIFAYFSTIDSPRSFNTTVSQLAELNKITLSSSITSSLLNMLVDDYLACLTDAAPWSANNSTTR
jgi:hypothetical protein